MGEVYLATDTNLGRQVAIKVLPSSLAGDAERLARFDREARTLASLNHPNIAAIYGLERVAGATALVMELVEGPTLADRIAQGPLPPDDAVPIAAQIADAVAAAHDLGIVHRDLKPANVKVRSDGTVKVLDFGLAKTMETVAAGAMSGAMSLSPTMTSPAMTQAGMLLGTAAYMSPEQARGKSVDKRADIWAFGCVLFEMLTGRRAFGGDDVSETIAAILRDQPDLTRVPVQLRRLLERCLEKDPRRRLRDIGDVWALLDQPAPAMLPPASTAPWWRRALPWGVAAVATIGAVLVSIAHFTEARPLSRLVRFQIQVPVEAGSYIPAISPDGTHLAYRAGGQVWVRDLASLEPKAVAPIDQPVGRVFWSGDGRFVVYGAVRKLLQVAASGGPSQSLRDLQNGVVAGGVGLPNGGMVVAQALGETLRFESGGQRTLPAIVGANWLRGGVSLLPDGKRVVYSVFEPEASRGIYVASIDGSSAPVRLLPDVSEVAYVPSAGDSSRGYLLLLRQGTLVALSVEATGLQPLGDPIEIAQDVASFAASAGTIVYRAGRGGRLAWYDRQGAATATAWSPGAYNEVALSPDATKLAVVRTDGPAVWVHEFAGEASVRLPTKAVGIKPVWSPAGDRIALIAATAGVDRAELITMTPDGRGDEEPVFSFPNVAHPDAWSPDGQWLMYTNVDPRTKEDLWIMPMKPGGTRTPEPFLITDNRETDAKFAPDGHSVAYVSDEGGTSNVYVRTFPSAGGRKWPVSLAGGYQPRWRGDGKELFYLSPSGQLMSVDVPSGLATAPGRPKPLFQTTVFGGGATLNNWYWDVSSDGQRFLINSVSGSESGALNVILNWQSGTAR
jgi:Tol biopolymer transport system component